MRATAKQDVRFFRYNGKYIVAAYGGSLYAYDPQDGAVAWWTGKKAP